MIPAQHPPPPPPAAARPPPRAALRASTSPLQGEVKRVCGSVSPLLLLPFPQKILRRFRLRPERRAERIELLLRHHVDAAILAHADHVEARLGLLVHPVLAFELGDHAL